MWKWNVINILYLINIIHFLRRKLCDYFFALRFKLKPYKFCLAFKIPSWISLMSLNMELGMIKRKSEIKGYWITLRAANMDYLLCARHGIKNPKCISHGTFTTLLYYSHFTCPKTLESFKPFFCCRGRWSLS